MSWSWIVLKADGSVAEPSASNSPDGPFPSQSDAESWIGEVWRDLLADGVDAVRLEEDGTFVYGPMSLHPGKAGESA